MTWEMLQNINWEAVFTSTLVVGIIQALAIFALQKLLKNITIKNENTRVNADNIDFNVERVLSSGKTLHNRVDELLDLQKERDAKDDEILEYQKKGVGIVVEKVKLLNDIKKEIDNYLEED